MRNYLHLFLCLIFSLGITNIASAQIVLTEQQAEDLSISFLELNLENYGLEDTDITSLKITNNFHDPYTGLHHIYIQQKYDDIIVEQSTADMHFNPYGTIFHHNVR